MSRKMLVDAVHQEETRVVIIDEKSSILEYDFTTAAKPQVKGNVYLAKVTRVEPSLQAAFVEYGGGKQGFLPFSEIHPNYYQIPTSDRQKLIAEEEAEAAADEEDDEIIDPIDQDDEDDEEDDNNRKKSRSKAASAKSDDAVSSDEIDEDEDDDDSDESDDDDEEDDNDSRKGGKRRRGRSSRGRRRGRGKSQDMDSDNDDSEDDDTNGDDSDDDDDDSNDRNRRGRRRRGGRNRRGGRRRGNNRRNNDSNNNNNGDSDSDIETVSGDDDVSRPRRKREYQRRYKIQEVIKRNQVLLVQVIKEERGNKGVSLTSFLSLAGRYCVLMPNSGQGGGVSRKIGSNDDRKRLKKVLSDLALPKGMGVIIRTAGAGHTKAEIKRDFDYLVKLWNQIREDTLKSEAPALIYEESNIVQRCIRDCYNKDIDKIWVEGDQAFKETKAFMRKLIPSHAPRVKQYKEETPLFHKHRIEEQLLSMTEPEVPLPSGGSIVMVPTEALISIDVNSGRSTRERNVEETAFKTNMEAAKVIAHQLRLRDLAGLIVIDFIDMMEGKNRRAVERAMKEALREDRAKIQAGRISSFGLMEMSRQRMRPSIAESINRTCPHCQGTGFVRSEAALGIQIIRSLEKEASSGNYDRFRVWVTADEAVHILNHMRSEIDMLEEQYDCDVEIMIDSSLHVGDFRLEKLRRKAGEKSKRSSNSRSSSRSYSKKDSKSSRKSSSQQEDSGDQDNDPQEEETDEPEAQEEDAEEKDDKKSSSRKSSKKSGEKKSSRGRKKKQADDEAKAEDKAEEKSARAEKEDDSGEAKKSPRKRSTRSKSSSSGKSSSKKESEAASAKEDNNADSGTDAPKEDTNKPKKPKRSGWWQKIID